MRDTSALRWFSFALALCRYCIVPSVLITLLACGGGGGTSGPDDGGAEETKDGPAGNGEEDTQCESTDALRDCTESELETGVVGQCSYRIQDSATGDVLAEGPCESAVARDGTGARTADGHEILLKAATDRDSAWSDANGVRVLFSSGYGPFGGCLGAFPNWEGQAPPIGLTHIYWAPVTYWNIDYDRFGYFCSLERIGDCERMVGEAVSAELAKIVPVCRESESEVGEDNPRAVLYGLSGHFAASGCSISEDASAGAVDIEFTFSTP